MKIVTKKDNLICEVIDPLIELREYHVNNLNANQTSNRYILQNNNGEIISTSSLEECNNFLRNGYTIQSIFSNNLITPYINIIYYLMFVLSTYLISKKRKIR